MARSRTPDPIFDPQQQWEQRARIQAETHFTRLRDAASVRPSLAKRLVHQLLRVAAPAQGAERG